MPTLAKPGLPARVSNIENKGSVSLPAKSALMQLAKGKRTINDYSKAGKKFINNGPSVAGDENQ